MKSSRSGERLLQGSEAVAEAALRAGCRFFAGYPITPATEIAEIMSVRLPAVNGTFIQMEDEIASMGAIIGASLAGTKSMTATSGPGFSLMQENLGYAIMAEIPCVVVNVMRGGPSTGLPTMPSQGDVMQARWGTHGDHPILVLSASTVRECYDFTLRAFNLSEEFRIPVILLLDEIVVHMREKVALPPEGEALTVERPRPRVPPEWYIPYEDTPAGIPAMADFGEGYRYHVTGLAHDIRGFPTERPDEIGPLMARLFRKISQRMADIHSGDFYQTEDAGIVIIAYGSVARTARRSVRILRERGIQAGLLKLNTLWPFMRKAVESLLPTARILVVPEMNVGQISREVKRVNQGRARVVGVNKMDGTLITPDEILERVMEIV
ncbi:2-oxoacid:acceptor oxidoreductase subunit alpha [Syntrophus aciditrophicus]|uniref:2-oxoglutarate synthase subunit n=1 Tax=Syntrophus aciditrophicus (strain SB) TaxID=56780 RepID=Q2LW27_SYNAS|nr:2-oxoacid:acceptor oxidoreductase subunit alpha [Syntrophus aciditrophicus]ABC78291.1 2-oxoglutarate synthase subunit [Syntrophus aciditrophicus SB]